MGVVWVELDWTRPDQSGSIPWAAAGSLSGHGGLSFPIEGNGEFDEGDFFFSFFRFVLAG